MNILIALFKVLGLAFSALFVLCWLVYVLFMLRFVFLGLSGRIEVRRAAHDPKLVTIRKFMDRAWWSGLLAALLTIVLALIQERLHLK